MPFNDDISGIENEFEFIKYLNEKKISQLNPIFQDLISILFQDYKLDDRIIAWKNQLWQKTDIFIQINSEKRRISIKKGIKNSVHVEPISEFIHFLISNHVQKPVVEAYLRYHYADGTTNGKGNKRLSAEEYKVGHEEEIAKINQAFNDSILLNKAINRFVLQGRNDTHMVDAIIYGVVSDFIWITQKEIREIILKQKDLESSAVHFGPLFCQPLARCLNYNPANEKARYCVQLKWYNLSDDILKVMLNRPKKE